MTIRITWLRAALALVGAVLFALLVSFSGFVSIAATSGHWPITAWFLHWTMQNSVRTQAALDPSPPVADRVLVSAAGHFAQACAACHGAPGVKPLTVMRQMTPHAPDLQKIGGKWHTNRLHWILQHGIKYSGMPGWGARGRPDEIARMVAFVHALPAMSPAQYRALVQGADRSVAGLTPGAFAKCSGCHGTDGLGRGPDVPVLTGQKPAYLIASLRAYQAGHRSSALMRQAADQLRPEEMRSLGLAFATGPNGLGRRSEAAAARRYPAAHRIVTQGLPAQQLPACLSCHDPARTTPYPVIHGQKATYTANRLRRWRGAEDVVDARKPYEVMHVISGRIPADQIDDVARYLEATGR